MATEAGIEIGQMAGGRIDRLVLPMQYPTNATPVSRQYTGTAGSTTTFQGTPQSLCEGIFEFTGNPADADTLQIGANTYRFKDTLAAINDVKRGATQDDTLTSLNRAINGTGTAGTDYYTGTVLHPDVSSTADLATNKLTVRAKRDVGGGILLAESGGGISAPVDIFAQGTSPYPLFRMTYGQATLHILGYWINLVGPTAAAASSVVITAHYNDGILATTAAALRIPIKVAVGGEMTTQAQAFPAHDIYTAADSFLFTFDLQAGVQADAGWWGYLMPTDSNGNELL